MKKLLIFLVLLPTLVFAGGYLTGPDNNIDNNTQDQHTRALDLRFIRSVGTPTTLNAPTVVDAYTITLLSEIGFVDGTYIGITTTDGRFFFATQIGAPTGKVITLDSPLDQIYPAAANVLNLSYDMVVDGSGTPITFQIGPIGAVLEVDITRILGYMVDTSSMDDSLFGSQAALANGCILRLSNGTRTNLWNVKSNGDFALLGYDLAYPNKPPAGKNSMRFRITYAGQDKHGVTLRLNPGDTLEFIIQDDITDQEIFNMMAQGHVVDN